MEGREPMVKRVTQGKLRKRLEQVVLADTAAQSPGPQDDWTAVDGAALRLRDAVAILRLAQAALRVLGPDESAVKNVLDLEKRVSRAIGIETGWIALSNSIRTAVQQHHNRSVEWQTGATGTALGLFQSTSPELTTTLLKRRDQLQHIIEAAGRRRRGRRPAGSEQETYYRLFQRLARDLGLQPPSLQTLRSELYRRGTRRR